MCGALNGISAPKMVETAPLRVVRRRGSVNLGAPAARSGQARLFAAMHSYRMALAAVDVNLVCDLDAVCDLDTRIAPGGPAGSLNRPRRPLSRGSSPASHPAEPLVSFQINRQLSG